MKRELGEDLSAYALRVLLSIPWGDVWFNEYLQIIGGERERWEDIRFDIRDPLRGKGIASAIGRLQITNIRANESIDNLSSSLAACGIGCTRSHPHENMGPECEHKTIVARQRVRAAADIRDNECADDSKSSLGPRQESNDPLVKLKQLREEFWRDLLVKGTAVASIGDNESTDNSPQQESYRDR